MGRHLNCGGDFGAERRCFGELSKTQDGERWRSGRIVDLLESRTERIDVAISPVYAVCDTFPKDIVICDWYYGGIPEKKDGAGLYPTMDYFVSKGFSVVTSPWHNEKGIDAHAEYVRDKGYFGFLETVWNHYRGHKFAQAFERSACAAWGKCRERPPRRQGGFAFSMHWRKCGWDMGGPEYSETGLWGSQVSPDAHDD